MVRGLVVVVLFAAAPLAAQAPRFEAASVKPNVSGSTNFSFNSTQGGFRAVNVPLRRLIEYAFDDSGAWVTGTSRLVGAPDWIAEARFDITARSPEGAAESQDKLRLQTLLIERFGVKVHREAREMPIFALVVARSDGRLGSQLVRPSVPCAKGAGFAGVGVAGAAPTERQCGLSTRNRTMVGGAVALDRLAVALERLAQRKVVNRTGLTGEFDFDLAWEVEEGSIYTALQEQLGLKLDSARGPVDVLVVDAVERPTGD
jgi:uncharacterized protein (TIGR03435 family)